MNYMKPTIPKRASVLLLISALLTGISASAATIYDNSTNDRNLRFGPTTQFGDEIVLGGPSTARFLTNFSFEFWALNNGTLDPSGFSPAASARIRFYLNDGAVGQPTFSGYATPGTVFYDSGFFNLGAPTDRSTFNFTAGVDFPVGGLFMPVVSNMTWTVQFAGLDINDTAGLDVYSPPAVGSSLPDYWEFSGASWALKTNSLGGVPVNMSFAAKFDATVPEPSTVVFGVMGGLGLLVFGRRFTKASR